MKSVRNAIKMAKKAGKDENFFFQSNGKTQELLEY